MKERTTRWRLLLVPPREGAENMARDTGLMDWARETGEAVFSVYTWSRPTLSLGRNQTAAGEYDKSALGQRGIDVVRRPTGGRALLHDREVTYSVSAPIAESETLLAAYSRINRILLRALRALGVEAAEADSSRGATRPGILPCFAEPASGELVTSRGKLVGSAQFREDGALLQHGSILIDDDQPLISTLLIDPPRLRETGGAATLHEALGRVPAVAEVAAALFDAVRALEDPEARPLEESETETYTASRIDAYRSELWTWRR